LMSFGGSGRGGQSRAKGCSCGKYNKESTEHNVTPSAQVPAVFQLTITIQHTQHWLPLN
jgi:hypothetical protein